MGILDPFRKTGPDVGNRTKSIPDGVWAPFMAAFLIFDVGVISLIVNQPWLFPILGTTAYLQVEQPGNPRSRFYNTLVGHYMGIAAGLVSITIFGLWNVPSVFISYQLYPFVVGAAAIAVPLTIIINMLLRASHPPAAATTLLVCLGAINSPISVLALMIGILIIALIGDVIRRIRLAN